MNKTVALIFGIVATLLGSVWTLQGLGYVGGSSMTGNTMWAIIGPIVVVVGIALVLISRRGPAVNPKG